MRDILRPDMHAPEEVAVVWLVRLSNFYGSKSSCGQVGDKRLRCI